MIFPTITDISLIGVFDRGIPNKERIVLKTNTYVNLTEFGILLGFLTPDNLANPICDHLFTFKETLLEANSWIFLYTGPGKEIVTKLTDTNEAAYVFYWGKPVTVFAQSHVIPVLFRIGAVQLGYPPQNRRQLGVGV